MSNRKPPAAAHPPAPGGKSGPPRRTSTVAQARPARRRRRDLFGVYFMAGSAAFILLFGLAVWGLRTLNRENAAGPATVTPVTIAELPNPHAQDSPIAGFTPPPTLTYPAPDALDNGPLVTLTPVTSVYTQAANLPAAPKLPAAIPQAKLALSQDAIDLGTVEAGGVVTREVTLANIGGRDLLITRIASDCDCLSAIAQANKLHTGQRTYLDITYDSTLEITGKDRVDHTLTLLTTDGQSPLTEFVVSVVPP
jgi:hypothetical protein